MILPLLAFQGMMPRPAGFFRLFSMPPSEFDLDAYLARIGLDAAGPPSLALLRAIVTAHTATIPFENLDIILGRPIRLDVGSVQAKLVGTNRGGYCFEQNTLLRAALEQLGFAVSSLMARVVIGAAPDAITPRTHMLLRVDLAGDEPQPTGHEDYRLRPLDGETLLQARLGAEWQSLYRFSAAPSHPIDHEVGNWFTSTKPDGLFTASVIAARPGIKCRKTLFNGTVTIRDSDNRTERFMPKTESALRDALHDHFGIDLNADELTTVHAAIQRFTERPDAGFRMD
jgi:N-hydroxyarylamine O-acetyltransferase